MRTHFPIVAILAQALAVLAGCNSSSTSVTNPSSAQRCAVTINGPASVGAAGGSGSLTVSTDRDCQWTAQAEAQWLSLSPTSGQGAGTVGFAASPNQSTAARTTAIVVNGQRMEITQAGGSCQVGVSPTAFSLPAQGGEVKASLTIASFCGWSVVSRAGWISVSVGNGTGPAEVSLTIAPNTGPPRSGIVDIAGIEVNVSQASQPAGCSLSVNPTTINVGAQSTQAAVTVTADSGCAWSAASTVPWISISSGGSGSGSGSVVVEIAANQGGARTGQLLIGGQLVRIDQSGTGSTSCTYSITPTSATIGAAGGQLSTQVTTNVGCAWTATSQASWLRITSGSTGSGPSTVSISADANGGEARSGTVNVAGASFTVTQAASSPACSYSIDPTNYNTTAAGGQVTVTVSAATGCAWSTTGLPDWITVTNGSGSGSGAATVVVGTNAGPARNATIQIAGRPFTVTQEAGACTYTVTPTTIDADASAQTKTVTVATGVHCSWTAAVTPTQDWLRITSGSSGTGPGTVTIEIDATPNQGNKIRTATLLVAGQTVTVNQAANLPACSYSIDPTSYNATAVGGQVTVTVSTATGCAWSTTGLPDWITVTNGSGSGSGTATVVVSANAGQTRNATIQIAGQPFTVTQEAATCTYTVAPTTIDADSSVQTKTVTVTTDAHCSWTATVTPTQDWLRITSGSSGTGPGTVTIGIDAKPNQGNKLRTATLLVAGQTVTVNQQ